jgi:hypothetical protein
MISRTRNLVTLILAIIGLPSIAACATTPPAVRAGTTQPYVAPPSASAIQPATSQSASAANPNAGWTMLFPGAHRFYVSSSAGDDINGNGGALRPFKTIAHALKTFKAGDDLLLKRGDVFYENFGNVRLSHNTLGAYGVGERPTVYADTTTLACITVLNSQNLRFVGLHLSALHRDPSKPDFKVVEGQYGIYCNNCTNVLIEDCLIEYFNDDVSIIGNGATGFRMRRCVIRQAYSAGKAFSQGIYLDGQRGALIEDCVFDTCGWNPILQDEFSRRGKPGSTSQPAAGAPASTTPAWISGLVAKPNQPFPGTTNIFNHSIYNNQTSNAGPSTIRNCIFVNAASTAVQQRPGGIIDNCLFIHNGMATDAFSEGDWGQITNNVVLGSQQCPPWAGGGGLSLLSKSGLLQNNIVAHGAPVEQGGALVVGMPIGLEKSVPPTAAAWVDHNVVYDWPSQGVYVTIARPQVQVTNNILAKTGKRLVEIIDFANVNYIFSNNNYEQPVQVNDPAQKLSLKQKLFALPDFNKAVNDTSSTVIPPGQMSTLMVDPTRTIESYAKVLNLPPTLDAFITAANLQGRDHWDPRLTASVINDYFREGFSLKQ